MAGVRRARRALRHSLRPSFYDDHEDVLAPSIGRACMHLCAVCAVLSLPATLSLLVRLGPAIAALRASSLLDDAVRLFPDGVEIVVNGSTLHLRPKPNVGPLGGAPTAPEAESGTRYVCWEEDASSWCATAPQLEPIRLTLPMLLHDVSFSDLPSPLHLPPARLAALATQGVEALTSEDAFFEGFPPLVEFEVGERVQVQHGYAALIWAGGWVAGTIVATHPARDVRRYGYTVELADGTHVRKRSDHLRRPPSLVLAHDDSFSAPLPATQSERPSAALRSELLALRTDMVLTPRQIHVLHGYSFAFGQYWQYKSARARTSRLTTLHSVSVTTATAYPPFALAAAALCDAPDEGVLVCSRVTAAARVAPWRKLWWVPLCSGPAGLHVLLVSVAALSLGALKSIMLTVPPIGLIHLPLAYMGANLLRHVDTPLTPVRTIAVLGALSATPFLLLDEALELGLAALEAVRAVRDGGRPLEASLKLRLWVLHRA